MEEYTHYAETQNREYLRKCREDILENLKTSEGGLYIGGDKNGTMMIGYGNTEILRIGLRECLRQPVLRQVIFEEIEKYKSIN